MTGQDKMIAALHEAGFPGVCAEADVIHARLWSSSVEFTATKEAEGWTLAVQWPVRATPGQIAHWTAHHPEAPMDIHLGETRVTMRGVTGDGPTLHRWAVVAEAMVAQCIRWRRARRALDEGM